MKRLSSPALTCALLSLGLLRCSAQAPDAYKTYGNARFGYSICYPSNLFAPQPEAENGDGREFHSKDGAILRAWGMNNALDDSIKQAYEDELENYNKPGSSATYKVLRSNWFVVSGTKGDRIVYHKTILKNNQFKSFEIEYDKSKKATYDPVASKIAGCFTG